MEQSRQINYYRIGSFVVAGFALFLAAVVVFGSGLFKKTLYMETYFNESVQGLAVGSPVKYLGMEIGTVKDIAAVDSIYNVKRVVKDGSHDRYIYVKMAISPNFFMARRDAAIKDEVEKDIESGLRVKLALQGLTGNAYLELDFLDSKTHPALPIYWSPKYFYIPSTTSTLAYFSDNVQYILEELKGIDIKKFFASMQKFADKANTVTEKANRLLSRNAPQVIDMTNNLRNITENLNDLSEQARGFPSSVIFGQPPPKLDPGRL